MAQIDSGECLLHIAERQSLTLMMGMPVMPAVWAQRQAHTKALLDVLLQATWLAVLQLLLDVFCLG